MKKFLGDLKIIRAGSIGHLRGHIQRQQNVSLSKLYRVLSHCLNNPYAKHNLSIRFRVVQVVVTWHLL